MSVKNKIYLVFAIVVFITEIAFIVTDNGLAAGITMVIGLGGYGAFRFYEELTEILHTESEDKE